jgi:hypothetical protein
MVKGAMKAAIASLCLVICGAIALINYLDLSDTEMGGGSLTGPLLNIELCGALLFFVCGLTALKFMTVARYLSMLATFLCLPLYIFLIAPYSILWISSGASSVAYPLFIFNTEAIAGLAMIILACVLQFWPRSLALGSM